MGINVAAVLFIGVVIILLLVYRHQKRKRPVPQSLQLSEEEQENDIPLATIFSSDDSRSPEIQKSRNSFVEPQSAIKEITYAAFPPGILPKSFSEVDSTLLQTVREKISRVKPLPSTSAKLLDLLKNPFSSLNDISAAVSTNSMFSAKVLHAINSTSNHTEEVTSVAKAITLLGYTNVRPLVLENILGVLAVKNRHNDSDIYVKACVHLSVVSACSGYLSKNVFHTSEYDIATIGLLHDIGKYFAATLEPLSGTLPGHPLYWLKTVRPRPPLIIREQIEYGMDHTMLGSLLADRWELSDAIKHGIEYHHYPSSNPPESIPKPYIAQSFVICLSDLICKALGYRTCDDDILPIQPQYYDMFGLSHNPVELITPALVKEITNTYFTVKAYIDKTSNGTDH